MNFDDLIRDMKDKNLISIKPALIPYTVQITKDGYYLGLSDHSASKPVFKLGKYLYWEEITPFNNN